MDTTMTQRAAGQALPQPPQAEPDELVECAVEAYRQSVAVRDLALYDTQELAAVRVLGKRYGYRRVMELSSALWYAQANGEAFSVGHCYSVLEALIAERGVSQ